MQLLAFTDPGLRRASNQDAALARSEGARAVLVVADGMGGQPAGEVASALVLGAFEVESGVESAPEYLAGRCEAARAAIIADVAAHPERAGMGSTVVAALVEGDTFWLAHVGDSRAYVWDEDAPSSERLKLLTRDHSVAQLAVESGTLSAIEALNDRRRHQLTRAVGEGAGGCDLAGPLLLPRRSCLLLLSDGVCGVLPAEVIAFVLERYRGSALAEALRDVVYTAGAPDNLAIALLDVRDSVLTG